MACPCSKNRNRLALLAGRSSIEDLPEEIRRVLANCPACREHYENLCAAICSLREVSETEAALLEKSLWSDLSRRLPEPQRLQERKKRPIQPSRWKQQFVPIFSVTTACLALALAFLGTPFSSQNRTYQTTLQRGTSLLPLPALSTDFSGDFEYAVGPDQKLIDSPTQPRNQAEFLLSPNNGMPNSEQDFSDPLELKMKRLLELKRQFDTRE